MTKLLLCLSLMFLTNTMVFAQTPGWEPVERALGRTGTLQGNIYRVNMPRSDMNVRIGDVPVSPGLALTSWVAFEKIGNQAMMMGDLVLFSSEVAPVLRKIVANRIEVTGLHNHILDEMPQVMYLHYRAQGDSTTLARSIKDVLSVTATPAAAPAPTTSQTDWSRVERILGRTGQHKGNLLALSVPRAEKIMENGIELPPQMGTAIAINIQNIGNKAATSGDFVLIASEVNPVIKALTDNGILVTAVHNHMLTESPRVFFLHFWGYDNPDRLAQGLKAALDNTNVAPPQSK